MKTRNTVQKQIILDSIKNTKTHPTALDLYNMLLKKDSTIGKSTIYRNLNQMVDNGDIKVITTHNGSKRYDGTMEDHDHFICSKCGKVLDLGIDTSNNTNIIEKKYKFKVINKNTIYEGICENCLEKNILN